MQIVIYTVNNIVHYKIFKTARDKILDHDIPTWENAAEVMHKIISENKKDLEKIKNTILNAPIYSIDFEENTINKLESGSYYDIAFRHMFKYVESYFFSSDSEIPYDDLHMKCNIGRIIDEVYDIIENN